MSNDKQIDINELMKHWEKISYLLIEYVPTEPVETILNSHWIENTKSQ